MEDNKIGVKENMFRNVDWKILWPKAAFLKLWSADHKWSSGSALVVLLD